MSVSIVSRLIAKDLYFLRPMIIGALVIGGVGVALLPFGETAFLLGWVIVFITVLLLGIFSTTLGVITERKEKAHLLVLTLPISPTQYTLAKLAANGIAFWVPWTLLSVAALSVIVATPIPDGLMSFIAALMLYAFCYHSAYLAVALVTDSAVWSTIVIIVGNTAPIFLIPAMFRHVNTGSAGPIWSPTMLSILAIEAALGAAVLALGIFIRSRQRDFA